MSVQTAFERIGISIHQRGVAKSSIWLLQGFLRRLRYARRLRNYVRRGGYDKTNKNDGFDAAHGTETGGYVKLSGLDISTRHWIYGEDYQAIPAEMFHRVMARLHIHHQDFVFIDIGSGKGKPMLLATDYPFQKSMGVEFSPELHEAACRNIEVYRGDNQRCFDMQSICADATVFPLPDKPLVLHMYHPFGEEVMAKFLRHLHDSLKQNPRAVYIVYVYPAVHHLMDAAPFLQLADSGESWRIYENKK